METGTPLNPFESGSEREAEALMLIARQIRQMPYLDPPVMLAPSVLKAIRQKRFPLWFRMLRWARSPRSLTFTPLQAAFVASLLILVSAVGVSRLLQSDYRHASQPAAPGGVPITLTLNMPEARSVSVVGTFNAWDQKGFEMRKDQDKRSLDPDAPFAGRPLRICLRARREGSYSGPAGGIILRRWFWESKCCSDCRESS